MQQQQHDDQSGSAVESNSAANIKRYQDDEQAAQAGQAEIAELVKALAALEWVMEDDEHGRYYCPSCFSYKLDGHDPDCLTAIQLAKHVVEPLKEKGDAWAI